MRCSNVLWPVPIPASRLPAHDAAKSHLHGRQATDQRSGAGTEVGQGLPRRKISSFFFSENSQKAQMLARGSFSATSIDALGQPAGPVKRPQGEGMEELASR